MVYFADLISQLPTTEVDKITALKGTVDGLHLYGMFLVLLTTQRDFTLQATFTNSQSS